MESPKHNKPTIDCSKPVYVDKIGRARRYRHGELKQIIGEMKVGETFRCYTRKEYESVRRALRVYNRVYVTAIRRHKSFDPFILTITR